MGHINYKEILEKAESYKKDISAFLRDMIAIPSESCNEEKVVLRIKEEMEKVSGQNLTTFFNQWLYKSDNLKISAHWEYDTTAKQVLLKINQTHYSGFVFDFPTLDTMKDDFI